MKTYSIFGKQIKQKIEQNVKGTVASKDSSELLALKKQIREKEQLYKKLETDHEALKKEREALVSFQQEVVREKETSAITSELVKTAKKLNVRETAVDDVIGLVSKKFKLQQDGRVVLPIEKEQDGVKVIEEQEPEAFLSSWLKDKEHFVQPPAAQPAKVPAVQNSMKPAQPKPAGGLVMSPEDFFGRR